MTFKPFDIHSQEQFNSFALETFHFQAQHCEVYRSYIALLGKDPKEVTSVREIPFLPIELFKTHTVYCGAQPPQHLFTSSATSGMTPSKHHIADLSLYEESLSRTFRLFFDPPERYTLLALLPSYLERQGSSLVYMVDCLMKQSGAPDNGFYLHNHEELYRQLLKLQDEEVRRTQVRRTLLIGVAFALLDFVEKYRLDFPNLEVVETGGMKGRGKELTRTELHQKLSQGLGTAHIFSEYGMAELLSQAYAKGGNLFTLPPWMAVYIRDLHDPFRLLPAGQKGGINIIDLANRYSCSFIETQDMGTLHHPYLSDYQAADIRDCQATGHQDHQTFEFIGRIPHSDLRGCNLLMET